MIMQLGCGGYENFAQAGMKFCHEWSVGQYSQQWGLQWLTGLPILIVFSSKFL